MNFYFRALHQGVLNTRDSTLMAKRRITGFFWVAGQSRIFTFSIATLFGFAGRPSRIQQGEGGTTRGETHRLHPPSRHPREAPPIPAASRPPHGARPVLRGRHPWCPCPGQARAVPPVSVRRATAPHLMTTRLPFTSTLSRVSLLERDMAAPDPDRPDAPLCSAAARALPQRPPAPPAPSPPRLCPSTIGPRRPPRVPTGQAACPSAACPPPRTPSHVSHAAARRLRGAGAGPGPESSAGPGALRDPARI